MKIEAQTKKWFSYKKRPVGLKICAITAAIKRYKLIIKKKKKHDKIVLLAKSKLNSIESIQLLAMMNLI